MQSKRQSLIETFLNIGSGFFISLLTWQFIIIPIFHIKTEFDENLYITGIFTIVSIIRSYIWRRIFNRFNMRK